MQPQRPQGTLTVCWSRHGWQVYWKLANWQYLRGPQSSSMMHSWVGGSSYVRKGRSASPLCPGRAKPSLSPPLRPTGSGHRNSLQSHLNAPQPQALPSWLLGVQPPTSTQAGRARTHTAHPSFCPVGCHTSFRQLPLCAASSHTPRVESTGPRPHFSAEQMGLIKALMSSRPRWLHRRGWSLSQAGPAD